MAGYLGAAVALNKRVENLVSEAYDNEAARFRADFSISCNGNNEPAEIAGMFSRKHEFKPAKEKVSYLETKIGFRYGVDDTRCVETGKKSIVGLPVSVCIGAKYDFSVDRTSGDVSETLYIGNFSGDGLFPASKIFVSDTNHDGLPDRIYIMDEKNNTEISIRNRKGNIEYENINEQGARQLYDLYALKFNAFKIEHDIDRAILDYAPKLEITEVKPEKQE